MTDSYSVGGEIDAWCTKCKSELGHTIVAIVNNLPKKVKCNTCEGQHNYSSKPDAKSGATKKSTMRKRKTPEEIFEEQLARLTDGDLSRARKYSINESFQTDEIIDHSKFGIGIVLSIVKTNKIETLFRDGPKLLIQNR